MIAGAVDLSWLRSRFESRAGDILGFPRRSSLKRVLPAIRVTEVVAVRERVAIDRFATGAEFRDFFKATYGPTIMVFRSIADDPSRVAELDAALAALGDDALADGRMAWEYLLLTARRT